MLGADLVSTVIQILDFEIKRRHHTPLVRGGWLSLPHLWALRVVFVVGTRLKVADLFVGHAESLLGLTKKFQMVHKDSGTAYQRIEARD